MHPSVKQWQRTRPLISLHMVFFFFNLSCLLIRSQRLLSIPPHIKKKRMYYLKGRVKKDKNRDGEIFCHPLVSLLNWPQWPWLTWAEPRNLEFHPGLPCETIIHCFLGMWNRELDQLGLKLVLQIWEGWDNLLCQCSRLNNFVFWTPPAMQ